MMRLRMLLPAMLLGLLLALGAFSGACGGDSKDDKSGNTPVPTETPEATDTVDDSETPEGTASSADADLEAYFTDVEDLGQTVDGDAASLFNTLNSSQDLEELKDAYGQIVEIFSTFLDGMKDIDPPEEVADEHAAAISSSEDFLAELESANDAAQDTTTLDEFTAAADTPTLSQLNDIVSGTCDDLQAIADANAIDVDLGCEV